MVARLRLVASPLHSLAFIPKREVKKERGRKLLIVSVLSVGGCFSICVREREDREREGGTDMTVKMVNTITACD